MSGEERPSSDRYGLLFNAMLNGLAYCRMVFENGRPVDFVYIEVNKAFEALTGLRNVVAKKVSEVVPGIQVSNPELFQIYGRVVLTGEPARFETYVQPMGRWFDISVFRPEAGHFAAVFENITARKHGEEQLRLRGAALEAAANAVMITDREGKILWVNDAFARLTGWSLEACRGKTPRILKSGHHDSTFYEDLWETILKGRVWQREMVNRRRDGSLYREDQTVTPVRDKEGAVTNFVAIKIDTTERRLAEEALRESEERYRTLAEAAQDDIFIVDTDGRMVYANTHLASRLGAEAGSLSGRRLHDVFPAEAAGGILTEIRRAASTGQPVYDERSIPYPGRALTMSVWLAPMAGAYGRVMGIARDITERKGLEEQLRQAQKMKAIGQLAGGVAHDFNNLLGVITGYSDLLSRDLGPSHPGRARLEQIQGASNRAADLTRQLLAFSRKQILKAVALDLNDVLAEAEKMLRRLIGEHIQLITAYGAEVWTVMADPGQLEQVIVNLALNARDAMPSGGKLVLETANVELDEAYAGSHPEARSGPHSMLAVSDTGHGMDAETLSHAFEPFFTTKEKGKGTGLGLATVYGIVKQSGGHVNVYSEVGRGTTFKVYLPRAESTAQTMDHPRTEPAIALEGTETILLAEDEEALRLIIREILEGAGYRVLGGISVEEVIDIAQTHSGTIDLLLTDVVMPRMSGRAVADAIRKLHPSARTLFMSGYTDEAIVQHGVLKPGVKLIQKPFTAYQLLSRVRELLKARA